MFGDVERKIEVLGKEKDKLHALGEHRDLNELELARLSALNTSLKKWLVRQEHMWKQKSRVNNLRLQDSNTKYFHTITRMRRRKRQVHQLRIENRIVKDVDALRVKIQKYVTTHNGRDHIPQICLSTNEMQQNFKGEAQ